MKKLLSILLVLCLLCPAALAQSGNVSVAESHIHEYSEGENLIVHAVFVLENRGDQPLLPAISSVVLMNKAGAVFMEDANPLYPMVIAPGARGYVYGIFTLDAQAQQQYDHAELYMALAQYSKDEQQLVKDIAAQIVYPQVESTVSGDTVTMQIKNTTAIDIVTGGVLMLFRSEAGEIVGAAERYVTSMPRGESAELTESFTLAPFSTVEIICYSLPM